MYTNTSYFGGNMNTLCIGADPEIFVGDVNGPRSIIGMIGGTKENPLPLPMLGDGFAVQEDNVALEYNIPPSPSREAFVSNISTMMSFLRQSMKDSYGVNLLKESAISFPDSELSDPRALVFGCDPDFNAWSGLENPRPRASDVRLRSCGGHVHIGSAGTEYQVIDPRVAAQACDLFLAVPSVLMDNGLLRKSLYGKAGAYRPKPYGLEYRTLSNFWVHDENLTGWVYDCTKAALDAVLNGLSLKAEAGRIQHTVNSNDADEAKKLINEYNLYTL